MFNSFNLKNNPAQVDLFENSTLRKYLSLSSILYFICGILGITGISLFYGYISSIFGFYTQASFGITLVLGLGYTGFELNKTQKLPTLNYSIIGSAFSLLLVTIFSTISNFYPTLLNSNNPTTPLIFLLIATLGLIFCFAVQKSQVLFMQAMISLNIGFFGFLAYLVTNYRSNILAVIGTDERLTLAIFVFANLVFLFQAFLFGNYHFLMNKGYKVISHIGSYLGLGFFFASSLISIGSLTSTIFGSQAYYNNSTAQIVDIVLSLLFLPLLGFGLYFSKYLKNDLPKVIMILFGIIWLLTILTKIAGIVNFDDLFPIYIGTGFIAIAILIGKLASNFENKYDK